MHNEEERADEKKKKALRAGGKRLQMGTVQMIPEQIQSCFATKQDILISKHPTLSFSCPSN